MSHRKNDHSISKLLLNSRRICILVPMSTYFYNYVLSVLLLCLIYVPKYGLLLVPVVKNEVIVDILTMYLLCQKL